MSKKVRTGRPMVRFSAESIAAIVSLARCWRNMKRKFTPNAVCMAIYGYTGDGKALDFVRNVLDNNNIEYDEFRRKVTPVDAPGPKPSICTHFVVTTDIHV